MNRYNHYDVDYPVQYQFDYIEMMCLLEEIWENGRH